MKHARFETLMPAGFLLFSLGYIAFALTMENARMIGDVRGYDPGGRFVPLLAAAAMAALSIALLVREVRAGAGKTTFAAPLRLTLSYLFLSVAYIALFRPLGYNFSTCLMVFWLTIINLRETRAGVSWPSACLWMIFTLAYLAGSYTLMRFLIRSMFRFARNNGPALMREPTVHAAVVTVALLIVFVVMGKALRRLAPSEDVAKAVQSSIGATLSIYITFRLLFLVQLPAGLMNW